MGCAECLIHIGSKLLHLVYHQEILYKVTWYFTADRVDLSIHNGDDFGNWETYMRETIRCSDGGGVPLCSGWGPEKLCHVVKETVEAPVQAGVEYSAEVRAFKHISGLIEQLYRSDIILSQTTGLSNN